MLEFENFLLEKKRCGLLIGLMFSCFVSMVSFAQDENSDRRITVNFGVSGCFDINVAGCSGEAATPVYGGGAGFAVRISRGSHLFAETGTVISFDNVLVGKEKSNTEIQLEKFSLHVPFDFGYKFDFLEDLDFFVAVGVDLSANLGGKVSSFRVENGMPSFDDVWRRFNVGCGFGAGFSTGCMSVSIMGYYGLVPMSKLTESRATENIIRVGATYYFGLN